MENRVNRPGLIEEARQTAANFALISMVRALNFIGYSTLDEVKPVRLREMIKTRVLPNYSHLPIMLTHSGVRTFFNVSRKEERVQIS